MDYQGRICCRERRPCAEVKARAKSHFPPPAEGTSGAVAQITITSNIDRPDTHQSYELEMKNKQYVSLT